MMIAKPRRATIGQAWKWAQGLLALLASLVCLLPSSARADFRQPSVPVALVGPTLITLPASGQSENVYSFTTPAGILAPYTLSVQNGPGLSTPPVAEGTIWLDDVQVAGPNDFRKGLAGFNRSVDSGPGTHTLRVVLRGKVGSGIRLTLFGRKLLSVPVAASPSSLEVAVNATANVAVTLSPPPVAAGTLKAVSLNPFKVSVPSQTSFAAGQTTVVVPVKGKSEGAARIAFVLNLKALTVPVKVVPAGATVASLSPPLATLGVGGQATVTVALQAAQTSAVSVAISSSPTGLVSHPATVSVPAGAVQASFQIQGLAAGSGQLTASANGTQATSQFTVLAEASGVASLLPATSSIAMGASEYLTLSLTQAVGADTAVALSAQPAGIVAVPASVSVPAGSSQAQVSVQGQAAGTATVRAELNGTATEAVVQVSSPPPELIAFEPATLELYNGAQGRFTVTLNTAQPEAIEVALAATPAGVVSVPDTVVIPAGGHSGDGG